MENMLSTNDESGCKDNASANSTYKKKALALTVNGSYEDIN